MQFRGVCVFRARRPTHTQTFLRDLVIWTQGTLKRVFPLKTGIRKFSRSQYFPLLYIVSESKKKKKKSGARNKQL